MNPSEILKKALKRLEDPRRKWVNHNPHGDNEDCCATAIERAENGSFVVFRNEEQLKNLTNARMFFYKAINNGEISADCIPKWNDKQTDFGIIKVAFEKAIKLAEENENATL